MDDAGPRRAVSGLCGWRIHRIALRRVENGSALASSIFATRGGTLPRSLLSLTLFACVGRSSHRADGRHSGLPHSGHRSGHRRVWARAASAQHEPSAPVRSAACMCCVAHDLEGDEIVLRCSLELLGSTVAALLDSRWVCAVGTIATPPCCLCLLHQPVLPRRGSLQGIVQLSALWPMTE